MRCELDTGLVREIRSSDDLAAMVAELRDGGHLILGGDSRFVQVARSGHDVVLQTGDGSRVHEAHGMVPLDEATEFLHAFYNGDDTWIEKLDWADIDGGDSRPHDEEYSPRDDGPMGPGDSTAQTGGGEKGFGGMLADEATRAIKRRAGRMVRLGLRRFLK